MKPSLLILAAGLGTRYGAVKQLAPMGPNKETLIDYSIYDALKSGFGKVVFIITPEIEKDFRATLFDRIAKHCDAEYTFQTKTSLLSSSQISKSENRVKPWGTAHAILCAQSKIHEPFAIVNSDDYYGRGYFDILYGFLSHSKAGDTMHCMVGYILKNTLSRAGSITRGICTIKNDMLSSVKETHGITITDNHLSCGLCGDEIVSMNSFGFNNSVFEFLNTFWEDFISKNVDDLTKEAIISTCVDRMISTGQGSVKVFPTVEKWFGMTYSEDKATVVSSLQKKIEEGFYPEKLWKWEQKNENPD